MKKGLIFAGFSEENPSTGRSNGAYRIATHLRKYGWDIEVVDYFAFWNIEELKKLLASRTDISWVGVSVNWLQDHDNTINLITHIRQEYKNIKIIVGGSQRFNKDLNAHYYIYGFGEHAITEVLNYEFGNGTKKPTGQPFFKGWFTDALEFYPAWPLETYRIEYEDRDFMRSADVLTIELARGCRFKCKFCDSPVLGLKEDTSTSEDELYQELQSNYDRWGITNYLIADETINERDTKLEKLASAVERLNFKPNFAGFIRLDLVNAKPYQLDLLVRCRIWGHFYGVESFNHPTGKIIGKGMSPDTTKETMLKIRERMLSDVGYYRGTASLIAGLPLEPKESLEKTIQWLKENWKDQHWHFWNLSIPKIGENKVLSAFGEDFSKFGYSEMSEDEIKKYEDRTSFEQHNISLSTPQIFWKNDYGDIFSFGKLSKEYDPLQGPFESKAGIFAVWGIMSQGVSVEQALSENSQNRSSNLKILKDQIIKSYIEKKLSL
jgi:hypothetical protein